MNFQILQILEPDELARVVSDLAQQTFVDGKLTAYGSAKAVKNNLQAEQSGGETVVYSATALHRVEPVTRGTRLVAVSWIQSVVRDEQIRTILFDLSTAAAKADALGDPELTSMLNKCCHNLLRHAADI